MDTFKRRITTHVEREDDRWTVAINLLLEIESVTSDLLSHAFFPYVNNNNQAWGYNEASLDKLLAGSNIEYNNSNNSNNNTNASTSNNITAISQRYTLLQTFQKQALVYTLQKITEAVHFYLIDNGIHKKPKSTSTTTNTTTSSNNNCNTHESYEAWLFNTTARNKNENAMNTNSTNNTNNLNDDDSDNSMPDLAPDSNSSDSDVDDNNTNNNNNSANNNSNNRVIARRVNKYSKKVQQQGDPFSRLENIHILG